MRYSIFIKQTIFVFCFIHLSVSFIPLLFVHYNVPTYTHTTLTTYNSQAYLGNTLINNFRVKLLINSVPQLITKRLFPFSRASQVGMCVCCALHNIFSNLHMKAGMYVFLAFNPYSCAFFSVSFFSLLLVSLWVLHLFVDVFVAVWIVLSMLVYVLLPLHSILYNVESHFSRNIQVLQIILKSARIYILKKKVIFSFRDCVMCTKLWL